MQEFLLIVGDNLSDEQLHYYQQRSQAYFTRVEVELSTHLYIRKKCVLFEFTPPADEAAVFEARDTGNFVADLGSWFFREEFNNSENNKRRLLDRLAQNTEQGLQEIEGAYNFVFYNASQECVRIITDRIGLCPAYLRKIGDITLISSHCLLLAALHPFELDRVGLQEFLLANKLFDSTTLFQGIKKIDAASILEYTAKGESCRPYWSIHCDSRHSKLSTREKVDKFHDALQTIMRRLGEKFNSPFVDLTAGWDSRTVIVAMPGNLPSFSTVTSGATENDEDVRIARQIAEYLRVPHYFDPSFSVSEQFSSERYADYLRRALYVTDGAMSAPLYANTLPTKLQNIARGADLTINGSGGELYRAYWWEPAQIYNSDIRHRKFALPGGTLYYNKRELARRVMHQQSDLSIFQPDFNTDIYGHLIELFERVNAPYPSISNIDQIANVYIAHRMGNWLAGYSKATSRLLPCLSPVLMSQTLEIAAQLDFEEKVFCRFLRRFHQSANPDVARIATGYGYSTEEFSLKSLGRMLPSVQNSLADIGTKVVRKLGISQPSSSRKPHILQNMKEMRRVLELRATSMKLRDIFEQDRLTSFLNSAQEDNFIYRVLYGNIYTVEMILRVLS